MTQPQDTLEAHLLIEQVDGLVAAAGIDGTHEILEAFWRSTSELLDSLASQITEPDLDPAAQTAHAVKGSAANIGARRLAETATAIEDACRDGDRDLLATKLQEIRNDYAILRSCFEQHLSKAS